MFNMNEEKDAFNSLVNFISGLLKLAFVGLTIYFYVIIFRLLFINYVYCFLPGHIEYAREGLSISSYIKMFSPDFFATDPSRSTNVVTIFCTIAIIFTIYCQKIIEGTQIAKVIATILGVIVCVVGFFGLLFFIISLFANP